MMSKRIWFLSVGPLDDDQVVEWTQELSERSQGSPKVELIDYREWYARAMDDDSVRDALIVLRAGIADPGVPDEVRSSVLGLLSDMETWLERDFVPDLD